MHTYTSANCGLPSFPINGYGQVYLDNTTMEGTRVLFLCSNDIQHSIEEAHVAVCNPDGNWQPNPASICLGYHCLGMYKCCVLFIPCIYLIIIVIAYRIHIHPHPHTPIHSPTPTHSHPHTYTHTHTLTYTHSESDISAHDHSRITTALVSSATVFIITSIVVMFFGFLCGRFMKCQSSPSSSPSECKCDSSINSQLSHPCPVYETITAVNYQQQNVNLMENVAYDSVQLN